nr:DUF6783 domain-containing protein [uncultured Eisenbergiella sp.]
MWDKFPTNCDAHLAESNFLTRSSATLYQCHIEGGIRDACSRQIDNRGWKDRD